MADYTKCGSCGGYHPDTEIEVITIKVYKGKNCDVRMLDEYLPKPTMSPKMPTMPHHQENISHIGGIASQPLAEIKPAYINGELVDTSRLRDIANSENKNV